MRTAKPYPRASDQVSPVGPATSAFRRAIPYLALLAGMSCLAAGGIFVRLSEVGPISTAFYRIAFSVPVAVLLIQLTSDKTTIKDKFRPPRGRDLLFLGLAGGALAADLILWHISFFHTTIANANLLANMVPFIIIPYTFWIVKETPTKRFVFASVVVCSGLGVLVAGKATLSFENALGDGLALATAVFYAIYLILVSRYRRDYSAMEVILWSSYGSLIFLLPVAVFFENGLLPTSMFGFLILFSVACVSHLGGQGLIAVSLGKIPLRVSALIVLLQPIIAGVISFLVFGESMTVIENIGFSMILSGTYIAKTSKQNRRKI